MRDAGAAREHPHPASRLRHPASGILRASCRPGTAERPVAAAALGRGAAPHAEIPGRAGADLRPGVGAPALVRGAGFLGYDALESHPRRSVVQRLAALLEMLGVA